MISVVIVAYRRLETLEAVLNAWLKQADEVYLCDCSDKFETKLPITHVRFHPDLGNKTRHAVALLTSGEFVIKADDDVLPKDGLTKDFLKAWNITGKGILGLLGRRFHGESYYKNTSSLRASKLNILQRADFVGVVTFTSRDFLSFDLAGCSSPIEDLFWQMKCYPEIPKWVVPTKNYENLPTAIDSACLFYNQKARQTREGFYREYYLKNYKKIE